MVNDAVRQAVPVDEDGFPVGLRVSSRLRWQVREGRLTVAEAVKRAKRNAAVRARDAAYRDLGLVKVRGALGGVYYE
jgi:hypothetical protein